MLWNEFIIAYFDLSALNFDEVTPVDRVASGFGIFFAREDKVIIFMLILCMFVVVLLVKFVIRSFERLISWMCVFVIGVAFMQKMERLQRYC